MRDLVAASQDAVVMIRSLDIGSKGSGFFISDRGHILTNSHVVTTIDISGGGITAEYAQAIEIVAGDACYPATVLTDLSTLRPLVYDYALLKIDSPDATTFLPIGAIDDVAIGDDMLCLGFPLDFDHVVATHGIVSSLLRRPSHINSLHQMNTILSDALIQFGNSGGPMIHAPTRKVVGVNTLGHEYPGPLADRLKQWRTNPAAQAVPGLTALMDYVIKYSQVGLNYAVAVQHAQADPAWP